MCVQCSCYCVLFHLFNISKLANKTKLTTYLKTIRNGTHVMYSVHYTRYTSVLRLFVSFLMQYNILFLCSLPFYFASFLWILKTLFFSSLLLLFFVSLNTTLFCRTFYTYYRNGRQKHSKLYRQQFHKCWHFAHLSFQSFFSFSLSSSFRVDLSIGLLLSSNNRYQWMLRQNTIFKYSLNNNESFI